MPAFRARSGVVGDLVGGETGFAEHALRLLVERSRIVVGGKVERSATVAGVEDRSRLDRQLICGNVLADVTQGAAQFGAPRGDRLVGEPVDHIERVAAKMPARDLDGFQGFARTMVPAEKL